MTLMTPIRVPCWVQLNDGTSVSVTAIPVFTPNKRITVTDLRTLDNEPFPVVDRSTEVTFGVDSVELIIELMTMGEQ